MCAEPRRHIGLTGRARAGKDTAAAALVGAGWKRVAFADPVRAMALDVDPTIIAYGSPTRLSRLVTSVGWEEAKQVHDVRRFLQRLGTDGVRRHIGDRTWIDVTMRSVTGPSVFTDVRFPNEADAIRAAGGVIVRVVRPGNASDGHESETAMDDFGVDAVLVNDSIPEVLHARTLRLTGTLMA